MNVSLDSKSLLFEGVLMVLYWKIIDRIWTSLCTADTLVILLLCVLFKDVFSSALHVYRLALRGYFLTCWNHLNWAFENVLQAPLIPLANSSLSSWQTIRDCAVCWEETCQIEERSILSEAEMRSPGENTFVSPWQEKKRHWRHMTDGCLTHPFTVSHLPLSHAVKTHQECQFLEMTNSLCQS